MTSPSSADSRKLPVWLVVATLLAVGLLSLFVFDAPLARWSIDASSLKFLVGSLNVAEAFGHGTGVLLIVITLWILDPQVRRSLPWVLAGAWGGGLAANVAKFAVGRLRPREWLLSPGHETQRAIDTFIAWFPMGGGGSGKQSFPSAHTATAFGLAVMLAHLYPRGRWWFVFLATLVGAQRIVSHAHFPSDVVAGALVGWIVARLVAKRSPGRSATQV